MDKRQMCCARRVNIPKAALLAVAHHVSALEPGSCCRGEVESSLPSYIPATIS